MDTATNQLDASGPLLRSDSAQLSDSAWASNDGDLRAVPNIQGLPYELLLQIMHQISAQDRIACSSVCRRLHSAASAVLFANPVIESAQHLEQFLACATVSRHNWRASLAALHTQSLYMHVQPAALFRDEFRRLGAVCPNLTRVVLTGKPRTNTVFQAQPNTAGAMVSLKLQALAEAAPNLRDLELSHLALPEAPALLLAMARHCKDLSRLTIDTCSGIDWRGCVVVLRHFRSLSSLHLAAVQPPETISAIHLVRLLNCPLLVRLIVGLSVWTDVDVLQAIPSFLDRHPLLARLGLRRGRMNDAVVKAIADHWHSGALPTISRVLDLHMMFGLRYRTILALEKRYERTMQIVRPGVYIPESKAKESDEESDEEVIA
ncbi:hypothetical protein H9P43_001489 [Blastocladiella emersonii ATCC 22665]|nr:hypothetical protein H9P43_001489 [Blastocladiella emersonii ATCC 22665]